MVVWDSHSYLQFADERGRPFADLLARVGADDPAVVVDLGCGPGQLTATLAARWPAADVLGLDSSPEMIAQAQQHAGERLRFAVADLGEWVPERPVDVCVSNAALQWVPGHRTLLPRLVAALRPGGWLAFQVPGNFGEPSHQLLHALAAEPRFADATAGVARPAAADPGDYLADLAALGCTVDAWETTYCHVLPGPDAVFRWISGTGARPVLQALDADRRAEFVSAYRTRLAEAYPEQPFGTVLPFRRTFVVAQRPAELAARPALRVSRNDEQSRYEGRVQDELATVIDVRRVGDVLAFTHTGTEPAWRGRGLAGETTRQALADVRARGLRVQPSCSFTSGYFADHPEEADLRA